MGKRNWTRWWKWATIAAGTLVIGGVVVGWFLFQHIPEWYLPIEIPPAQVQAARDDCTYTFDSLSGQLINSTGSFEFRVRQDQLNAWLWLVLRGEIWPAWKRCLPNGVQDPQVVIQSDGIRVAAAWRRGSIRTVISARLEVRAGEDGATVRLLGVQAGSLPLPPSKVREFLGMLDKRAWPAGERAEGQIGDRRLPELGGLYDGVVIPNAWIWPNGRQPFKILRIDLKKGEAILTLQPLPRQAGRQSSEPSDPSSSPIWHISPGPVEPGKR